jgi:hypothetical protein
LKGGKGKEEKRAMRGMKAWTVINPAPVKKKKDGWTF